MSKILMPGNCLHPTFAVMGKFLDFSYEHCEWFCILCESRLIPETVFHTKPSQRPEEKTTDSPTQQDASSATPKPE